MHGLSEHLLRHGAKLVFANVFAEQLGAPIPAEAMLVLSGSLAAKGCLSPLRILTATVMASVLADATLLFIGRRCAGPLARLFARFRPRRPNTSLDALVSRWGLPALLVARFLPGAAQLIIPLAGARQLNLISFLAYDLAGIAVWASLPFFGGMLWHRQAEALLQALSGAVVWLIPGVLLGVGVVAYRRRRAAKGRRHDAG